MLRRLPLSARRAFRLALAAGLATFVVYAAAIPVGFLAIVVTLVLASAPGPPPGLKAAIMLVAVIAVTMLYGMLLGPVLTYVPVAGVLLALLGVAVAAVVSSRPGGMLIGTLVTMSTTVVAVVAAQSSAAGVAIVKVVAMAFVGAIVAAQVVHAVFPEDPPKPSAATAAPARPVASRWIALRSALIMLPPLIAALVDPASYIMLLMKGSQLSQQASEVSARRAAGVLVSSTAMGGAVAMGLWWLLGLWPGLTMLTLSLMLAVLLMARPMYGVVPSRFPPDWWLNAMITAVILLGPAVGDSGTGDDIQLKMLIRLATFIALALYAALAVHAFDRWRSRGLPRRRQAASGQGPGRLVG